MSKEDFIRDDTDIRVLSLFSGCGGLDLGAEQAGANIVFANDFDPDACDTLRKYFPNCDIVAGDIDGVRHFPGKIDLVVGGYPCQSFSMGGNRNPADDERSSLYKHFLRAIDQIRPRYFVAENVSGLKKLRDGVFLQEQVDAYSKAANVGYSISAQILDAKEYGIPQTRKRLLIVGVRKDLNQQFFFPPVTHGKKTKKTSHLLPFASHGEAIKDLPLWPEGEFYERPHDPEGHFSWYYMSRNRKADWDAPSYTVVANWRHITLHPASPVMKLTWSNLADGWKQRWDFSDEYEHLLGDSKRPILKIPRRLSWRECAQIQTFPKGFEPTGDIESKFSQLGNAVPPQLARIIFSHLFSGAGLTAASRDSASEQLALSLS